MNPTHKRRERRFKFLPLQFNEIYLGDSFKLCEQIPPKTVDLILEDMPYNITACDWDVKIDLQLYWETRLRILKPIDTQLTRLRHNGE